MKCYTMYRCRQCNEVFRGPGTTNPKLLAMGLASIILGWVAWEMEDWRSRKAIERLKESEVAQPESVARG